MRYTKIYCKFEGKVSPAPSNGGDTGGWGGGYGGGGGGGGGGAITVSKPKDEPDDINAQLENAGNQLVNQNKAIKDKGNAAIDAIRKQRVANNAQLLRKTNQTRRMSEWQPNQQKEQSAYAAIRRTMGNAAYGSGIQDLNEGMARYDDMQDVELINTWKENMNNAYDSWFQANSDLVADYNNQVAQTRNEFANAYNNYLDNIANINSQLGQQAYDKANEISKVKIPENVNLANQVAVLSNLKTWLSASQRERDMYNYTKKTAPASVIKNNLADDYKEVWDKLNPYTTSLAKNGNAINVTAGGKTYDLSKDSGRKAYADYLTSVERKKDKNAKAVSISSAVDKALNYYKNIKNKTTGTTKLTQEINDGEDEISINLRPNNALTSLVNPNNWKAKMFHVYDTNPNIPDSLSGATDYIRGTREDARSRNSIATPKSFTQPTTAKKENTNVNRRNVLSAANSNYWSKAIPYYNI